MKITAKLMYGLPYSAIEDKDKARLLLGEGKIDWAAPYAGAPIDEWFVGVEVKGDGSWFLMENFIDNAVLDFNDLIQVDGRLKAVPHVAS